MFIICFPWILAFIAIIGVVLNIKKKPSGFVFYTISNIGWIFINLKHEIYAQAFLFFVFTGLSIYGWIDWKFIKKVNWRNTMEFKEWLLNDKSYEADWCRKKLIYSAFHKTRMFAFEAAQLAFEAGIKEGMKQTRKQIKKK